MSKPFPALKGCGVYRTITGGGELTESYAAENGEVKMSKQELITMIENAGFEAVERDTVYNRVDKVAAWVGQ